MRSNLNRQGMPSTPGLGLDDVLPITASDQEIEAAVADAELPALLAALAMVTGDSTLVSDEVRPPIPPMGASIKPQGGMPPEMQAKARTLATRALIEYRNRGCPPPSNLSHHDLDRIMRFLTKDAGNEYIPLLRHELGLPADMGAPTWHKDSIAPGTDFRVAVIGAGLSGVAAAYRLQQAGVPYVVFEKNPEVGGVWWNNTYPGCRLDTPNFAYSFSFAQKPDWPQQFSCQSEIQKYISEVATGAAVRRNIQFETEVLSLIYDDASATWRVSIRRPTGAIEEHVCNAVITAVGQLNRPSYPKIKGLERFAGRLFHSAEWPSGLDLANQRVAVVGTGASAYQIVPSIVGEVAELKVFQRNPPWMLPTPNYHDDIKPGMAWLLRHVPYYGRWYRFWQFWIAAEGRLPLVEVDPDWSHPVSVSRANEQLRQECMAHLEKQLDDRPDLLVKLTPTYPPGAKRLLRDNGVWASALKQPNAELITDQIDHLTEDSIVTADGRRHEVDIIVFATGFQASDYLEPMVVQGREGRDLHQWWGGDCRAYLGITIPGFPNLFMTAGPNTSVIVNGSAIFSAECAVEYALSAIGQLLAGEHMAMDCREEPFWTYNRWVDEGNLKKAWGVANTTSWYKNSSGRASQPWPYSLLDYWKLTENANLDDYELLSPLRSDVRKAG